jgi:hyaluronan synthase
MAVVMPVTYILFTPLALFTLDSSSWETRKKRATATAAVAEPAAEPAPAMLVAANASTQP